MFAREKFIFIQTDYLPMNACHSKTKSVCLDRTASSPLCWNPKPTPGTCLLVRKLNWFMHGKMSSHACKLSQALKIKILKPATCISRCSWKTFNPKKQAVVFLLEIDTSSVLLKRWKCVNFSSDVFLKTISSSINELKIIKVYFITDTSQASVSAVSLLGQHHVTYQNASKYTVTKP